MIVHFVESLGGIRAVQAFRREPRNQEIFDALNDDYRQANLRAFRLIATYSPGIKVIGNVTIAGVLTYGGWRVLGGQVALGVLAAFLLYLRRFFEPMQELSQFYNALQSATAALEKLAGVLDERPAVPEPASADAAAGAPSGGAAIEFRDVTFGYRDGPPVLADLSLTIPAGQIVALVGATGAGKSTVAKLVARFYDPVRGTVLLDGVDLRVGCRRRPAPGGRDGHPGEPPVLRHGRRQHPVRPPRRARRRRGRGRPGDRRARIHRRAARGVRHRRAPARRAGSPPVSGSSSRSPARSSPTRPC